MTWDFLAMCYGGSAKKVIKIAVIPLGDYRQTPGSPEGQSCKASLCL